jgi:hypothetical protein
MSRPVPPGRLWIGRRRAHDVYVSLIISRPALPPLLEPSRAVARLRLSVQKSSGSKPAANTRATFFWGAAGAAAGAGCWCGLADVLPKRLRWGCCQRHRCLHVERCLRRRRRKWRPIALLTNCVRSSRVTNPPGLGSHRQTSGSQQHVHPDRKARQRSCSAQDSCRQPQPQHAGASDRRYGAPIIREACL